MTSAALNRQKPEDALQNAPPVSTFATMSCNERGRASCRNKILQTPSGVPASHFGRASGSSKSTCRFASGRRGWVRCPTQMPLICRVKRRKQSRSPGRRSGKPDQSAVLRPASPGRHRKPPHAPRARQRRRRQPPSRSPGLPGLPVPPHPRRQRRPQSRRPKNPPLNRQRARKRQQSHPPEPRQKPAPRRHKCQRRPRQTARHGARFIDEVPLTRPC